VLSNWLKVIGAPSLYASQSSAPDDSKDLQRHDHVPWIGTTVLVNRPGHAMKGYSGVVKSVQCNQDTSSGLRVIIQFAHLDSSAPFQSAVFDYDDLLEQRYIISISYRLIHFRLT
jgi:hypothetical protein